MTYSPKNNNEIAFEDLNNSLAIASAVTAYSRVFMSNFKLFGVYYSDTDSLFLSKELDLNLIGKELGQFKLEHFFKEIVFLSAKCYAGLTVDGNYICKIKGYKNANDISFDVLKSLLKENSFLNLKHVK